MNKTLPSIVERARIEAPAATPQALTWHGDELWMGSRDLRRIYRMEKDSLKLLEEFEAPGIPWAAASVGDAVWFTLGEGEEDDRYLRRYQPGRGFSDEKRIACPEFTGSYLSFDGKDLYLSQWYKHRILKLSPRGEIEREIAVGAEISGHVFVDGVIYVLYGTEQNGGDWRLARLDPGEEKSVVEELATVPFQCRSLAFDGRSLWTNHREADRIVCFDLPRNGTG
ncbi:MAG TPA: hypothetical protein VM940_04460 [Chthoniobacterales bacterium]|nr:hypothetical protein [Chthoniobacterales bacterium]